jgi:hypothetical protein
MMARMTGLLPQTAGGDEKVTGGLKVFTKVVK